MNNKRIREVVKNEKIAHALSDDIRISILSLLKEKGPMTITEIANTLKRHRSSIYRHIVVLENAELVRREIEKNIHVFAISKLGEEVLEIILKKKSIDILFEIKKKKIKRYASIKRILSYLIYTPSIIFTYIGIKGVLYPGKVRAFSRILWLSMFTGLAILWTLFIHKIRKTK